jgi:predicted Zn-dependent protease
MRRMRQYSILVRHLRLSKSLVTEGPAILPRCRHAIDLGRSLVQTPMKQFSGFTLPQNTRKQTVATHGLFQSSDDEGEADVGTHRNADALRQQGNEAAARDDWGMALRLFDEALRCNPTASTSAILHEQRAQVLMVTGRTWEAVEAAHNAVALQPDWEIGHLTLGRAQLQFGEPALAACSLELAMQLGVRPSEVAEDLATARSLARRQSQLGSSHESSYNIPPG